MTKHGITIGSVWDDRDPRQAGRTVEVMAFAKIDGVRYVRTRLNTPGYNVSDRAIGRRSMVREDRFTSRYRPSEEPARRFVTDADGTRRYEPKV